MWGRDDKVLGVLGGMGPLATQLFYRMLIDMTDADRDQDHLDMIILNHASIIDRTEAIMSGRSGILYDALLKNVIKLEENGVYAIAIPCNTSHALIDRLKQEVDIPIIDMIRETAKYIKTNRPDVKKVGILATDGTVSAGLYQKACDEEGLETFVPSKEGQALIMSIIYHSIKGGNPVDYNDFIKIQGELAAAGCHGAIMGCTELSCVKEILGLPSYYVDALEVLAFKSISICGKRIKKNFLENKGNEPV